ncbi:MAG: helix-turn-helix domain-containing protein [Alphaproteobacteria bacterium]|nr:helix-turn-helix domain-containing protein [Alphaproteobacteria bacterium]
MNEREVAAYMGSLSVKTLQRYRREGNGPPFIRAGGRVLYDRHDCDIWLAARKVTNTIQARALQAEGCV